MEHRKYMAQVEPMEDAASQAAENRTERSKEDPFYSINELLLRLSHQTKLTLELLRAVLGQDADSDLSGFFDVYGKAENNPIVILAEPDGTFQFCTAEEADELIIRRKNTTFWETDLSMDGQLCIRYDMEDIVMIGEHNYLTGPLIITEIDEDGNEISINLSSYRNFIRFKRENTTEIGADGNFFPAFRLD